MTGDRQRLVFLNNQGLASFGGGVTILRHLVDALAADCNVTILSFDPPGQAPDSVRQLRLPAPPTAGQLWRFGPLIRARHLAAVLPRDIISAADVVVVMDCHFGPALHAARPRHLIHLPLSCTPRQEWFGGPSVQRALTFVQYAWLERRLAHMADRVVVSSGMQAREMRRFEAYAGPQPTVLHPGFAVPPMPVEPRLAPETEPPLLLGVGRIEHVKNYHAAVAVLRHLADTDIRLAILGDGPLAEPLRGVAEQSGLGDRIALPGAIGNPTPWYARARLFLHPSRYESFGIAVFEAMRAGVPPVLSRTAPIGIRDLLRDGHDSCHVDFEQPAAAAAAIRRLLADPGALAAMGQAARETAERIARAGYAGAFRAVIGA
jgi:glycosyltransferase involved in cell wall biosynthesis